MSTRATYQVENQTYYIHHDGYPEGAAVYFYKMITHDNDHAGLSERFIRANDRASFIGSHDEYTDTEFQYTLDGKGSLTAKEQIDFSGEWRVIFTGKVSEFINQHAEQIENFSPVTYRTGGHDNSYISYFTIDQLFAATEAKQERARELLDAGHTGNSSSLYNEIFKDMELLKTAMDEFSEVVAVKEFIKEAEIDIDKADEIFYKAYNWESVEKWKAAFRVTH